MKDIRVALGSADEHQIEEHLLQCDASFIPVLSSRVDIKEYSDKIKKNSLCIEVWYENELIGLLSVYCNNPEIGGFITSVSVLPDYQGNKIADILLHTAIQEISQRQCRSLTLEVHDENVRAMQLYKKYGFQVSQHDKQSILMMLDLNGMER